MFNFIVTNRNRRVYKGLLPCYSMKTYKGTIKIRDNYQDVVKTIQYSSDFKEDVEVFFSQFELAEHIEVLSQRIKEYTIEDKLRLARVKVMREIRE